MARVKRWWRRGAAPPLDHYSGSWIIRDLQDGRVIETFDRDTADAAANLPRYRVETARAYLCRLNREIREAALQEGEQK